MKIVMFYHSLVSDWNHGNAHFLRGVVRVLLRRGHDVTVFEPRTGWSRMQLLTEQGPAALVAFEHRFPDLTSVLYDEVPDLDVALDGADLVLVHEWNDPGLVAALGAHREQSRSYRLLFHDTHHRSVSAPHEMERYDLSSYDGVLAFGALIRDIYLERGWTQNAWVWHEAADTSVFTPQDNPGTERGDVVWVGNWGDGERTAQLHEYLVGPIAALEATGTVHGVRYPPEALAALRDCGIRYGGWIANHEVPALFARYRATVHVPRQFYTTHLPGIPTIRPFEALACGIPLLCAPWEDSEGLFRPGTDYLVARNGRQMRDMLRDVLIDEAYAAELATNGLQTLRARHTCAHRVDELLGVCRELGVGGAALPDPAPNHRVEAVP